MESEVEKVDKAKVEAAVIEAFVSFHEALKAEPPMSLDAMVESNVTLHFVLTTLLRAFDIDTLALHGKWIKLFREMTGPTPEAA